MTLGATKQFSGRKTTCGVNRYQDSAADIVVRRPRAPYYNRQRNGPYKGSRNLVWTQEHSRRRSPDHDQPLNKRSRNLVWTQEQSRRSPDNQPQKNAAYDSNESPFSGISDTTLYQPRNDVAHASKNSSVSSVRGCSLQNCIIPKSQGTICKYWISGNCKYGEQCRFLHSWCTCPGFEMMAALEGHKKDLKGIALPLGSDGLYSASDDGTLRVWAYSTGQCMRVINLGAEAGSLISEGPWVFIGMPNAVKALNVQTAKDFHLEGPLGQVHAMAVANDMLFAGTSSGMISVWKGNTECDPFKYVTSLTGHDSAVVCIVAGRQYLYSGSVDQTIKVWDLNTLQCTMTLRQHTDTVTSLLCWDQFLISGSLDGTVKAWAFSQSGELEVIFTHRLEHGVRAISGMTDADVKPIIFCSCDNNTVFVYDLPSFAERGRIFSTHTVGTLTIGDGGQIYTGDGSGKLRVWSLGNQRS
ncbi:PREDICTED: zinc finger CCCH domain-containing protein 62-like [Tarenaya hassleriana]|uniref:zinc finger CCCH domain-containing protein 62-like n=1 Tax=Tarenaya hassleriana TaxID=28532 RepID=UPI00053C7C93|nr:PREDICTED: zinc finger CCCH domain-containing protein 62-like [Tarenaya hassleriana]XP_010546510.1 PREDICTED: zinc finger CCCH domain-containing protein 62-like [Tarenaya hassleriana]